MAAVYVVMCVARAANQQRWVERIGGPAAEVFRTTNEQTEALLLPRSAWEAVLETWSQTSGVQFVVEEFESRTVQDRPIAELTLRELAAGFTQLGYKPTLVWVGSSKTILARDIHDLTSRDADTINSMTHYGKYGHET